MKKILGLFLAVNVMLTASIGAMPVFADKVSGDAVAATLKVDNAVTITVPAGQPWSTDVGVRVEQENNTTPVFQSSMSVSGSIYGESGIKLSKTVWEVNSYSQLDTVNVSGTAPSLPGSYTYKVTFSSGNAKLKNNSDFVNINLNVAGVIAPDTTAPTVEATPSFTDWTNNDVSVVITARDNKALAEVSYRINDGNVVAIQKEGTLASVSVDFTNEGAYNLKYWAEDAAGNISTTGNAYVNIDKTAPNVVIAPAISGIYKTSDSIKIDYSADDSLSGIDTATAVLNGIPVAQGQIVNLAPLAGINTLAVTAKDRAGNITTKSAVFEVVIDSTIELSPKTLNLKSKGGSNSMTAYIEFPANYDVSLINVSSIKFNIKGVFVNAQLSPTSLGDYDVDGIKDLMVKVDREKVIAALGGSTGDVCVVVTGKLGDGRGFTGSYTIRVIN